MPYVRKNPRQSAEDKLWRYKFYRELIRCRYKGTVQEISGTKTTPTTRDNTYSKQETLS